MPIVRRRSGEEIVVPGVQTGEFTTTAERQYRLDATGGPFNVHLPTAAGRGGADIILYAEHDSGNDITVVPSGIETIIGAANITLSARETVLLSSNGVDDWMKLSG